MYRSTDLAEIVTNPSPVTRKYLATWFTGSGSFGIALASLGWPVNRIDEPLLVWDKENGLRVDITVEEKIMYGRTLFHYVKRNNDYTLQIYLKKLSLSRIANTIRTVWVQSKLLANPQHTYELAKSKVENIPLQSPEDLPAIEKKLKEVVWPNVITVDYIGEYVLSILTNKLSVEQKLTTLSTIQQKARPLDWYTQAMLSWSEYKEGKLSETDLLNNYGFVAGDDYELTRPRYYELLHKPKPEIGNYKIKNMKITNLEDLAVGMHYLRSEVKRRSLIWIAALRESLIKNKAI